MNLSSLTLLAQQFDRLKVGGNLPLLAGVAVLVIIALIIFLVLISYGRLWIQAYMSSAQVSMFSLIGMTLRQVNAHVIVQSMIRARQAGLDRDPQTGITTRRLEAHYLAGGNVPKLILALIEAHNAKKRNDKKEEHLDIDIDFDRAAAIDLAGRDVLEAVQTSINPRVIDCPAANGGKSTLTAMAKNGVELKVRARVTVRTNVKQLIGGATEETVIARVGEGIITSIGSADSHWEVLENPNLISKAVLNRGLDAHTAYEIVSIDIAEIDVGENIGARLLSDKAEADTRVARAKAEIQRTNEIAREQEMRALNAANRALVVEAEVNVQKALAASFRAGGVDSKSGA